MNNGEGDKMAFESEIDTFFMISIWLITLILLILLFKRIKKFGSGFYYLWFVILQLASLYALRNVLYSVTSDPVMASQENTLRLTIFILAWISSMIFLIVGIFNDYKKYIKK
jgi:H+/gluconate symporter-like permease